MTEKPDTRLGWLSRRLQAESSAGVRPVLRGVFGSFAILVAAKGLEILFFGPGYFSSLALHPFWIVVVLAAILEGPFVGVLTAALAAWFMDRPPRPIGVDITAHYIDLAMLPLQWLMAALCLGYYRANELRRLAETDQSNRALHTINEALAQEIGRLDKAVHAMELAAVVRNHANLAPTVEPLVALHFAGLADVADRFPAAALACTGQPCALYIFERNRLRHVAGPAPDGIEPTLGWRSRHFNAIDGTRGAVRLEPDPSEGEMPILTAAAIRGHGDRMTGAVILASASEASAQDVVPAVEFLASILGRPVSQAEVIPAPPPRDSTLIIVGGRGE